MPSHKAPALFRPWDVVLILLLLVLVGLTLFFALAPRRGNVAEVYLNGTKVASMPLNGDGVWSNDHVKVVVSDGAVWVAEADCPDKLCEKCGAISRSGETIVCLPNQLVVSIPGKGEVEAIS